LSGLGAAGVQLHPEGDWRGKRYGLPEEGPGSMASFGNRVAAVVVDLAVAGLIGGLGNVLTSDPSPVQRQAFGITALVVLYVVLLPTAGQTIGMRVAKLRVVRLRDHGLLSVPAALLRALLVVLTIPALFTDRHGRGLHDKASGSIIVRT
jgi:uncharacterized RDD family membrane protein YckC